jgi:hypothetical protein
MNDNMISKGRHNARPLSVQFGYSGTDDKPQAVVQFEIVGENDPFAGWTISAFCYLHDKSWERSIEGFRHMGWTGDDLDELPNLCDQGQLGEVEIVVDHEEWEGEWSAKVKWINKVGGGVKLKKPMDGTQLKSFAAQMRGKIRTVPVTGGKPRGNGSQGPTPNAPAVADEDVPF